MRRLVCRFVGHRRSAYRAWPTTNGWKSYCKRCRVKLVRLAPSVWEADPDPSPPEAGDYIVFQPTGEIIAYPRHIRLTFSAR